MSQLTVEHKTIIKSISSPEDILDVLVGLGEIDADFSGDNGDEYLWDAAKKKKFDTNAKYLANKVVFGASANTKKYGIKAYTDKFAKEWLANDHYYDSLVIDVVKLDGYAEDTNMTGIYAFSIIATAYV
jgi:hypothetical protein